MNNFNRGSGGFKSSGNKFGGGGRPKEGKRFGGSSSRSSASGELYKATCSDCGKVCEVPFKPNGEKPVFCSDCFGRKLSDGNRGENRTREDGRPRPHHQPTTVRPVMPREHTDTGLSDVKKQLANLEQKLNRILDIINPPQPAVKVNRAEPHEGADTVETVPTEKKGKRLAVAKKVPSTAEIKSAVANAMAPTEAPATVVKPLKKSATKAVSKKVVAKKAKKSAVK